MDQKTIAALAALCVAANAHAITRLAGKTDNDYLTFGNTFTTVGRVAIKDGWGSGTLIAKSYVLTAAHVVNDQKLADLKFQLDGKEYGVSKVILDTDKPFDDMPANGNDIAILQLDKEVAGITPSALYGGPWDNATLFKASAAFAGFGFKGDGTTGAGTTDDMKRWAATQEIDAIDLTNPLDMSAISRNTFWTDFDDGTDANNTNKQLGLIGGRNSNKAVTTLEGASTAGDSGGGFFIKSGADWVVAGVATSVNDKGKYGSVPLFTALRDHRAWAIKAVPEPSSFLAFGVGAAFLGLTRRRRGK